MMGNHRTTLTCHAMVLCLAGLMNQVFGGVEFLAHYN